MTQIGRIVCSAIVAAAAQLAAAQVLVEGPPPPPEGGGKPGFDPSSLPEPIKAGVCKGRACRLSIRVNGNCDITIDQQYAFITGSNVQILWSIAPGDYVFPEQGGVEFKSEYNPLWREEFYGSQRVDAQTWQWYDSNSSPDIYRYTVTVVHKRTGRACTIDPGVVNDWP